MARTMESGPSDVVREYASENHVAQARRARVRQFSVNTGDIHKALHFQNRVPIVCNALQSAKFLKDNGLRIVGKTGPRSGLSTTVTITYEFVDQNPPPNGDHPLLALRGIFRNVFRELGGGENFIRQERQAFSAAIDREGKQP